MDPRPIRSYRTKISIQRSWRRIQNYCLRDIHRYTRNFANRCQHINCQWKFSCCSLFSFLKQKRLEACLSAPGKDIIWTNRSSPSLSAPHVPNFLRCSLQTKKAQIWSVRRRRSPPLQIWAVLAQFASLCLQSAGEIAPKNQLTI